MDDTFLFVVTSHDTLGSSGNASGSWLEELAAPYWAFVDAGLSVMLASPRGGAAPLDPMSRQDEWLTEAGRRFLAEPATRAALDATNRLADVADQLFPGLFRGGGVATPCACPGVPAVRALVARQVADGRVVAGICHGVIALGDALDPNGEPLVKNRRLTCISDAEDMMMGVDKIVPVLPEQMMRKLRAIYSCAAPLAEHVVVDPPFFTGQNPASAAPLAATILGHLERAQAATAAPAAAAMS